MSERGSLEGGSWSMSKRGSLEGGGSWSMSKRRSLEGRILGYE
jgi:hypothetical protein